ncbi:MAG: 2-succinyl-5-enolpyruvyl-6-hydroxy-3-cyclohexene-1-carboxylic-acid synthase, partial [Flavobacteriales bacterium]
MVVSPGSRNAPVSFTVHAHPEIQLYSIPDERVAGYFALGMSQQINEPVALICTSGSAGFNYGPAVAEAFFQKTPLIVLTADRPEEWVAQGEGQTIFQKDLFGKHVLFSAQLNENLNDSDLRWFNQRTINEAWEVCTQQNQGPVHLNLAFREPLYGKTDQIKKAPIKKTLQMEHRMTSNQWDSLAGRINSLEKVMVIVTQNGGLSKNTDLNNFASHGNVLVLTETTSNTYGKEMISCIDRLLESLDPEKSQELLPELVITIGHNIISKKLKNLLRSGSMQHWHVDETDRFIDTFQQLEYSLPVNGDQFLTEILKRKESSTSTYHSKWLLHELEIKKRHGAFLEELDFCDLKSFSAIMPAIPAESHVQMGNSSVVRYIQLFDSRPDLHYFGNRGTSGIDGCTSTAIGAAVASKQETTLITGDIAFFYDSNAFWHNSVPKHLKIVLINNGGGGIFRIINGPSASNALEECFETPHKRSAEHIAKDHGL